MSLQVLLFIQAKLTARQDEDDDEIVFQAQDIEDLGMTGDEDVVVEISQIYFGKTIQVASRSYCRQCCCLEHGRLQI